MKITVTKSHFPKDSKLYPPTRLVRTEDFCYNDPKIQKEGSL